MSKRFAASVVKVCVLALTATLWTISASGQSEVKEKPAMYSYISNWQMPRAQWGEMEKGNATNQKTLDKALASGTIMAYGNDTTLVHTPEGETHDEWWSAMSMAGVLNVLEQFYSLGSTSTPVLVSATKHWDDIYESHYYGWHAGSYKNVYTRVGMYKLKASAPDDAVDTLSKNLVAPFFEKLLADGTIHEYEIDEQAIHTHAPGTFLIVYIASSAEALDKVEAAVEAMLKANPLGGSSFGSMTDSEGHRDGLFRTTAIYK
jgi:hypothetical protein